MHDSALTIGLSQGNGSAFLKVKGDLDAYSVVELCAVLESLHVDSNVEIDMAGVRFMDSSGLDALISHHVRIKGTNGSLRITNPSRHVDRVLEITGMANLLCDRTSC